MTLIDNLVLSDESPRLTAARMIYDKWIKNEKKLTKKEKKTLSKVIEDFAVIKKKLPSAAWVAQQNSRLRKKVDPKKHRWYQTVVVSINEDGGYRVYSSKKRAIDGVIGQFKILFGNGGNGGNWKRRGLLIEIPGDAKPFHCGVKGCDFSFENPRGCRKHLRNFHLL